MKTIASKELVKNVSELIVSKPTTKLIERLFFGICVQSMRRRPQNLYGVPQVTRTYFANLVATLYCSMLDFLKKIQGIQYCTERSTQHCPKVDNAVLQACHRVGVMLAQLVAGLR